jgi:hypothetical protein
MESRSVVPLVVVGVVAAVLGGVFGHRMGVESGKDKAWAAAERMAWRVRAQGACDTAWGTRDWLAQAALGSRYTGSQFEDWDAAVEELAASPAIDTDDVDQAPARGAYHAWLRGTFEVEEAFDAAGLSDGDDFALYSDVSYTVRESIDALETDPDVFLQGSCSFALSHPGRLRDAQGVFPLA